jgi:hypothetical protein
MPDQPLICSQLVIENGVRLEVLAEWKPDLLQINHGLNVFAFQTESVDFDHTLKRGEIRADYKAVTSVPGPDR